MPRGRELARKLTTARLLWVDGASFDNVAFMATRFKGGDSCVTRHHLRREKPEKLINLTMQKGQAIFSGPARPFPRIASAETAQYRNCHHGPRGDRENQQEGVSLLFGVQGLQRLDRS